MAGGTGDGAVAGEARVVVEEFAERYLAAIHGDGVGDGANGLVLEGFGREVVGVELGAVLLHPGQRHLRLGVGERGTPVGHVVLHERHGAVGDALLDLGKVHFVHGLTLGEGLHHGSDVKGAVAFLHVFRDERFGNGEFGVERQVGIGGVAEDTTAVVKYLSHLFVGGQRGIGCLVHPAVRSCQSHNGDSSAQ